MLEKTAVIDYGMGNLRSVQKALGRVGADAIITQDAKVISSSKKLVLPGVGAIAKAMEKLSSLGLVGAIKDAIIKDKKPFLGICLGLQLLFNESEEGGKVKGLNIIPGKVRLLKTQKIPHIGWNQIKIKNQKSKIKNKSCPLLKGIPNNANVYFCHSYYVKPKDRNVIAAKTIYGLDFTSVIWKENIFGVQFHPEKSQKLGLKILKNFLNYSK